MGWMVLGEKKERRKIVIKKQQAVMTIKKIITLKSATVVVFKLLALNYVGQKVFLKRKQSQKKKKKEGKCYVKQKRGNSLQHKASGAVKQIPFLSKSYGPSLRACTCCGGGRCQQDHSKDKEKHIL